MFTVLNARVGERLRAATVPCVYILSHTQYWTPVHSISECFRWMSEGATKVSSGPDVSYLTSVSMVLSRGPGTQQVLNHCL